MNALLEIHLLQNFAPSNLNRDDTGSPKDAFFGGTRRGRISSQSLKRAMRMYFGGELTKLMPQDVLAKRSKRFLNDLANRLTFATDDNENTRQVRPNASWVAEAVLTLHGIFFVEVALGEGEDKYSTREAKSEALAFLGNKFLDDMAALLLENWEVASQAGKAVEDFRQKKRSKAGYDGKIGKEDKKKIRREVAKAFGDIEKEISKLIDGFKAVDVALFGRMLADLPEKNQYAACQVAHAISTHKIDRGEDFYTAVDDLKPDDNAGADMLGTVEFNSACYYRYMVIDLEKLVSNLQNDSELAVQGVEAFLRSSIYALPSGKQNSFAAHQLPGFVAFTVRRNASPRSLANAFENPVTSKQGLLSPSVDKLVDEWEVLETAYGQPGEAGVLFPGGAKLEVLQADGKKVPSSLEGMRVASVDTLIAQTLERVRSALGL